jgi:hypothetical protein
MKQLLTALVILTLSISSYAAPKTLSDVAKQSDKYTKKVWFGPAPGQFKKIYDIGLPKKIALVSFYIYDTGSHEFSALAATYGGTYFKSVGISESQANIFASKLAEIGVPVIKEKFAEKGIQVLTPMEFLDTPEKIKTYNDFKLTKTGLQKFSEGTLKWMDKNPHVNGAADGYRMIPFHASFLTQKILADIEEFRKALGVDALMSITNHTGSNKGGVHFGGAIMQVFGPNPEPRPENEKYVKWWWPGIVYPTPNFAKGFKGVTLHTWETKKKPAQSFYEGYEVVPAAMSERQLGEWMKYYKKGEKKAKK